ncbi:MAG: Hint domain-containing protein, partial [Verrucomicrobiota bacterium]
AAKMLFGCIPEGTEIDTPKGPRPIESLQVGDIVFGYSGAPVRVLQKHAYLEQPEPERFYHITFENGATVHLTDLHRIMGTRARDLEPGDKIGKLTVASTDTYNGVHRSYDLLTEDEGYRIQGVPVNSMIDEMKNAKVR